MGKYTLWDHHFSKADPHSVAWQEIEAELVRRGVGISGARQFLAGEIVSDPADRVRLAGLVKGGTGYAILERQAKISLIIPAVQAGRRGGKPQAPAATSAMQDAGVSAMGVDQFLGGLPVTRIDDRRRLVSAVAAAVGGPSA